MDNFITEFRGFLEAYHSNSRSKKRFDEVCGVGKLASNFRAEACTFLGSMIKLCLVLHLEGALVGGWFTSRFEVDDTHAKLLLVV